MPWRVSSKFDSQRSTSWPFGQLWSNSVPIAIRVSFLERGCYNSSLLIKISSSKIPFSVFWNDSRKSLTIMLSLRYFNISSINHYKLVRDRKGFAVHVIRLIAHTWINIYVCIHTQFRFPWNRIILIASRIITWHQVCNINNQCRSEDDQRKYPVQRQTIHLICS